MDSESQPSRRRITARGLLIAMLLITAIVAVFAIMRATTNDGKPTSAMQPAEKEMEQSRAEVARAFDRAVKEHSRAATELAPLKPGGRVRYTNIMFRFNPWGLSPYSGGRPVLNRSAAMEDLTAKCLAPREKGLASRARACVEAAGEYLAHKDAAYRTVACEFLAWFPQYAVESDLTPAVGALLGDRGAAFEGVSVSEGPRVVYITRIDGGVRVSDVARLALVRMTTFSFAGPEVFRPWWGRNKEYRRRLWYWSLRWRHVRPGRERAALADLDDFRPGEALRLLLLTGNSGAKLADSGLPPTAGENSTQSWPVRERFPNCPQFSPETIADFVRKHELKGALIRIVRQNPPWPEARGAGAMRDLLHTVVPILPLALDKSDVDLVAAEIKDPRGVAARNQEILVDLVKAAIRLDPKRAERILVDQLEREPHQPLIAAELVRRTGLKHWQMIRAACPDRGDKQDVIGALAELRTPQAAAALGQWLAAEDWTPKLNEYGYETDSGPEFLFEEFVKAAAALNGGKGVIAQDLLERSRWQASKDLTPEQTRAANKPVPAARAEAIVRLKKFLARAAAQPATQPAVRSADRVKKLKAHLETFHLELSQPSHTGYTRILTTKPLTNDLPREDEFRLVWDLPAERPLGLPDYRMTVRISETFAGEIIDDLAKEGFFARAKAANGTLSLKPTTVLLAGTSGRDYLCYEVLNEARAKTLSAFMERTLDKATAIRDARLAAARDALVRKAVALQSSKGRIARNSDQNPTGLDFSDVLKWSGQKRFVERFTKAPKPHEDKINELSDPGTDIGETRLWALCALLDYPNSDVKIRAAGLLATSHDVFGDAVPALLAAAKSNDHLVSGSENATIHGIYRIALKKAMERITGQTLTVRSANDPMRVEYKKVGNWLGDVFLSWGPGVKCELERWGPGKKSYLDLDTGKVYAEPDGLPDEKARRAWCAKMGIDVVCDKDNINPTRQPRPDFSLVGVDLQAADRNDRADNTAERWFELRASDAKAMLAKADPPGRPVMFPSTFVFKTRPGRIGQLQFLQATDDRLTFRYRLVRNRIATTQPAAKPVLTLKYHKYYRGGVDHVAFSPDGRMLCSTAFTTVRLTDVRSGKLVRTIRGAHANSIAFSPDGKFLVKGTNGGKVEVLGIPTLVREHVLPVTRWSIYAVAVSHDSKLAAACAADGTVQVWDIHAARKLRTFDAKYARGDRMAALAFSPDRKRMAELGRYGRCEVWDMATGKLLAAATGLGNEPGVLRFSRDGGTLGIASGGGIYLWKLGTDKSPAKVKTPDVLVGKPRINGIGFSPAQGRPTNAPPGDFVFGPASISPDLRIAASVLENGKIALWDVSERRVLRILPPPGHNKVGGLGGGVHSLAFSANGEFLATGNYSGHAEVWQLKGDKLLTHPTQHIDAHGIPGPWGAAIEGLRTRLILRPVKPSWEDNDDLRARPTPGRRMPLSEGIWWRVSLQVKNETNRKLTIVWPEFRRAGAIVITDKYGRAAAYHSVAGDSPRTRQIPIPVLPGDITTTSSVLLGRNHDMDRPGKYRIQFPGTQAKRPLPDTVTNPTLPPSNVLTFENTPATKVARRKVSIIRSIELVDEDLASGGLYCRVPIHVTLGRPAARGVYGGTTWAIERAGARPDVLIFPKLTARLRGAYTARGTLEIARQFIQGDTITIRLRYIDEDRKISKSPHVSVGGDKQSKSVYLLGEMPKNLRPGRYAVKLELDEYIRKDGKVSIAPKGKIRHHERLTGAFIAPPAVDTRRAGKYARRIGTVLPKGWSVETRENVITVRRDRVVNYVYSLPNGPDVDPLEEPKPPVLEPRAFVIVLKCTPPVTGDQYRSTVNENEATAAKLEAMRAGIRHITHKFDDYSPQTPEDRKLVAAYRKLQGAYRSIPDLYASDVSIFLGRDLGAIFAGIADPKVRAECTAAGDKIKKLFHKIPPDARPTTQPATMPSFDVSAIARPVPARSRVCLAPIGRLP